MISEPASNVNYVVGDPWPTLPFNVLDTNSGALEQSTWLYGFDDTTTSSGAMNDINPSIFDSNPPASDYW